MEIFKTPILLASKSPRRSQLLKEAGFEIRIDSVEVEEIYDEDLEKESVAAYLAELKADASKTLLKDKELLIAADTIVLQENVIYGKPKDREDAVRTLETLSNNSHKVITGVCMIYCDKKIVFSEQSTVFLDPLSKKEIEYYVDFFNPYDKAGAYAIQEWIGHCKISKIEGTYNNIMGLPVQLVYKNLVKLLS